MSLQQLKSVIDKLEAFDFAGEQERIVSDHRNVIADMQAEQLALGKNSKGEDITLDGRGYTPFTIQEKKAKGVGLGKITSRITWFMTGALYGSLYAEVSAHKFYIKSNSFKFDKLVKRSGAKTIGLNETLRRRFAEDIALPEIRKVFISKTGLKF